MERVPPGIARHEAAVRILGVQPCSLHTLAHARDLVGGGEHHRPALHPDRAGGHGLAAAPGVEGDVVVVTAGGDERRLAEVHLLLEADHVAVEGEALGDVADVEVEVAHLETGPHVLRDVVALDRPEQVGEVERRRAAVVAEAARPCLAGRSTASSIPFP